MDDELRSTSSHCRHCLAMITWARWRDTGRWVPLNFVTDFEKGEVVYCDELFEGHRTVRKATPEEMRADDPVIVRYRIHFNTCKARNR